MDDALIELVGDLLKGTDLELTIEQELDLEICKREISELSEAEVKEEFIKTWEIVTNLQNIIVALCNELARYKNNG